MDSAMEYAVPLEKLRIPDTSQAQQFLAREIADSDAESDDDAIVIDDEKPEDHRRLIHSREKEQPEETIELQQLPHVGDSNPVTNQSPTIIHTEAREASIELDMELGENIGDKSLEQSLKTIESSTSPNDMPETPTVAAPESLSNTDNDYKINANDHLESVEILENTSSSYPQPAQNFTLNDLMDETKKDTPDVPIFNSRVPESIEAPAISTRTEDTVPQDSEETNPIESIPITAHSAQPTATSDLQNREFGRHRSPASPLAEALLSEPSTAATQDAPEASVEDKDDIIEIPQFESAPTSSLPEQAAQVDISVTSKQKSQEDASPEPPQAELTPEQKHIVSSLISNIFLKI